MKPVSPRRPVSVDADSVRRVPDEYEVNLKSKYTIPEHFHTMGKNLSHHLKRRWDDPYLDHPNYAYIIHLTDQSDLELIRRDSGVSSIRQHAELSCHDCMFDWSLKDPSDPLRIAQEARQNWHLTKSVLPAKTEPGFVVRKFLHEYDVHLDANWTVEDYLMKLGCNWLRRTRARENPDPRWRWTHARFIVYLEDPADVDILRASAEPTLIIEHAEYLPLSLFENDDGLTCNAEPNRNPFFQPERNHVHGE
jgi:hypothetical protein